MNRLTIFAYGALFMVFVVPCFVSGDDDLRPSAMQENRGREATGQQLDNQRLEQEMVQKLESNCSSDYDLEMTEDVRGAQLNRQRERDPHTEILEDLLHDPTLQPLKSRQVETK